VDRVKRTLATALGTLAAATCAWTAEPPAAVTPFWDAEKQPLSVRHPGLDVPEPEVTEVRIGYFGPSDPGHADGGDMWVAASLAVSEANLAGGHHGRPFRLVARWSDQPWTAGAAHVTRLVFDDDVWAIVGGPDGATTHLAEQIIVKTQLALVGPSSTDATVNFAGVPWMFSCVPSDKLQAVPLAAAIAEGRRDTLAVVSATDHDSRTAWAAFRDTLRTRQIAPTLHLEIAPDMPFAADVIARLASPDDGAALVIAGARDAARLVTALRRAGHRGPLYGSASMGRQAFLAAAGADAEGVVFPWLVEPASGSSPFAQLFAQQTGHAPDFAALATYDALRLVIQAIQRAGLNRGRVAEALRTLSPWQGVSGTIEWDNLGQNRRPVRLGTIRGGHIVADVPDRSLERR
jgi:branched-chain amino acid transport system substrate-binding protein